MLLNFPDAVIDTIVGACSFRDQEIVACVGRRLRTAVRSACADAAAARRQSRSRHEPLPLLTELGLQPDAPRPGPNAVLPPAARVLAAFDAVVPPLPEATESPLRAWYRQAAAPDPPRHRCWTVVGCPNLSYSGQTDRHEEYPAGFGRLAPFRGHGVTYVGDWADGLPHGLGLLILADADGAYAWCHGEFAAGRAQENSRWVTRAGRTPFAAAGGGTLGPVTLDFRALGAGIMS